jgi:hypothetical protein
MGLGPGQNSGDRNDDYSDPLGMKRKRSFTGPPSSTAAGGAYGNAA